MSHKLKYGLFILAVISLIWLAFKWFNQDTQLAQTEELVAISIDSKIPQSSAPIGQTQFQLDQQQNQTPVNDQGLAENWQDDWLNQMASRRYSEDTVVELSSLAIEYESCGNRDISWRFMNQQLTQGQEQIKTAVEKHCADLLSSYPFLENNQLKNGVELVFNSFPASSPLGRFFQQQANPSTRLDLQLFMTDLIPLGIKTKNSQILIMAEWIGGFGNHFQTFDPAVIGSQNNSYLNSLQSIALTALSCEFQTGLTCMSTSKFMQDKCFSNEQFCGLAFDRWYDVAVTPGMAKDVELLKQHYLSLAAQ